MNKKTKFLFILSGLLPLLGLFATPPSVALLIYTIFVATVLFRNPWQKLGANVPRWALVLIAGVLVGFLTETLAWWNNYFEGFKNPNALYNIYYGQNLAVGIGFYLGLAVALALIGYFFRFSVREAFLTYGFFGILLEQQGAVLAKAGEFWPVNPAQSVLFLLYVFLVHGSIAGLMYIPMANSSRGARDGWYKYPLAWAVMYVMVGIGSEVTRRVVLGA